MTISSSSESEALAPRASSVASSPRKEIVLSTFQANGKTYEIYILSKRKLILTHEQKDRINEVARNSFTTLADSNIDITQTSLQVSASTKGKIVFPGNNQSLLNKKVSIENSYSIKIRKVPSYLQRVIFQSTAAIRIPCNKRNTEGKFPSKGNFASRQRRRKARLSTPKTSNS